MNIIHSTHHGWQTGLGYNPPASDRLWASTDSQEQYGKNLGYIKKWHKVFGDWPYENAEISYHYNNLGMRCDVDCDLDFDYSKYTVFLGCSHVEGVGVIKSQTIPAIYEQLTGEPTLNFGIGGAGQESIYHLICWLLAQNKRPKKIIVLWSYNHRQLFILPPHENNNIGTKHPYVRNTVGDIVFELSQAPVIKEYVKPKYFLEQALLKNSMFVKIVDGFKQMHEIHDFDIFAQELNPHLPEHISEKFANDKQVAKDYCKAIIDERTIAQKDGTLGKVLAKYHARDVFLSNYNGLPTDFNNVWGGHYGVAVNTRIANYIISKIT